MLFYKNWLETRTRFAFLILWSLLYLSIPLFFGDAPDAAPDLGVQLRIMGFVWAFGAVFLAGAGVRTQAGIGGKAKGLHGSTLFTLSLPVSRTRLLIVRTAVGLAEVMLAGIALSLFALFLYPPTAEPVLVLDAAAHLFVVFAAVAVFYSLSTLVAAFVDDPAHMWIAIFGVIVLWRVSVQGWMPDSLDISAPLVLASPLMTQAVPWVSAAAFLTVAMVFFLAALKVIQVQEY